LIKNGKTEQAKEILKELIKSKNNYVKAQALLLLAEIEPTKKVEYLEKVIQIGEPQQKSEAVIKLVEYNLSKGDRKRARILLVKYENLITDFDKLVELYTELGAFDRLYHLLEELIPVDPKYADEAYNIARKYRRIEFYKLAVYSKNPQVVTDSVEHLVDYYLKEGNLKEAIKIALVLKVRNIKVEPSYSELYLKLAKILTKEGYKTDACTLLKEINEKHLATEEKLTYEGLKVDCSK
jgi:tetratricopeptide (TPR) repeat protein